MSYASDLKPGSCTEPARRETMIPGRGGGYGFEVSDWERLNRFLILGHEGGTYYAGQRTLTVETVDCIDRLLEVDPGRVVNTIVEVSTSGRAPKNDPAVFALAYVASKTGTVGSYIALSKLRLVCRTGTHLFDFLNYSKELGRGWGTAFKQAVANWYYRDPLSLAMQVTKYAQRNGWSHRDVLRKCHPKANNSTLNSVFKYVAQNKKWLSDATVERMDVSSFLAAVWEAKNPSVPDSRRCALIREFGLLREHMPTESLNNPAIWEALLENMPLTAMIRNLGKMSSIGLLKPLSNASQQVVDALSDAGALREQRVHPVTLLLALKTYQRGRGVRGSLCWTPDQQVMAALDDAFYKSFETVEPTGKRFVIGVDVSGSMRHPCIGSDVLSCREAAVVMAMLAARTEQKTFIHGFSTSFVDLGITMYDTLSAAMRKTERLPFAATRVATPIEFALNENIDTDVFVVYTDNETNRGPHPYAKLQEYRERSGIPAKMAVFGFNNSNFSVARPDDAGMMDFVGLDAASPRLLADFVS